MANKPSIPKGTRDFGSVEMAKRNYIFDTIKEVYALYGFRQIETPAMETLQTLMGKYGEEGDKLLFKVLNSGDFMNKLSDEELQEKNSLHVAAKLCEKGLRYELMQMVDTVFTKLGINVQIKINNRKILTGIAEVIGEADKIVDITVAIDKLDKIGLENVNHELKSAGVSGEAIEKLQPIISLSGSNGDKLEVIKTVLGTSEIGLKGVEETRFILNTLELLGLKNDIQLDLTLARGLNYYTGAIFEVKALDVPMGSITGGGRYDNLTGIFGMPGLSGVGISFGADRIYDVLNTLDLYPKEAVNSTQVLFINFGEQETAYCLPILKQVRDAGIRAEIYPDSAKMKKQMNYANAKGIPFVVLAGENEMQTRQVTLKNMETGEQRQVSPAEAITCIQG